MDGESGIVDLDVVTLKDGRFAVGRNEVNRRL